MTQNFSKALHSLGTPKGTRNQQLLLSNELTSFQKESTFTKRVVHGEDVGIADLTEFLIVQVTHRKLRLQRRFILKAKGEFSEWQEQRDAQLLQQLLTKDSLQIFLKAILFDVAARPPASSSNLPVEVKGGNAITTLFADLSIEDIIRSCTEDSSRIEEINRVLKAFEKTPWIDDEFRHFWATFIAAEAEAREVTADG